MSTPSSAPLHSLETLHHDHRFAALGPEYFSWVQPTPLPEPRLLHFNAAAAALIDLDPAQATRPEFTAIFAGNQPLPGGRPLATLYAGHQFGQWVPELGDGRAILISQVRNRHGESWDLQLKGAGRTPYSRFGDGRAVLRSSIREYLCGEALHGLGIPTTRALCLIGSPEIVQRETLETAAVICRMAPSHVRFGHFEVFYARNQHERLGPLADHIIHEHAPQYADDYPGWLDSVSADTARLMAQWQSVGFCHGVMNTDNMSILGLTLDYGPFGFLDAFDPAHVCNHSDEGGRYAYHRQPQIAHWNVSRLLQAALPLLHAEPETAVRIGNEILARYPAIYAAEVTARWRAKLGLRESREVDVDLINRFLDILQAGRSDFSRSFRLLSQLRSQGTDSGPLRDELADLARFDAWCVDYRARLQAEQSEDAERRRRMDAINPLYVLRNHLAQRAIERAQAGDIQEIVTLMRLLQAPCVEQPGCEAYAAAPPPGTAQVPVSCSS
jgi:serine/tyrosine/threonine adenylyltransferase